DAGHRAGKSHVLQRRDVSGLERVCAHRRTCHADVEAPRVRWGGGRRAGRTLERRPTDPRRGRRTGWRGLGNRELAAGRPVSDHPKVVGAHTVVLTSVSMKKNPDAADYLATYADSS